LCIRSVELQISGGLSEGHLVLADVVRSGEISDDASRSADAHVADERKEPSANKALTLPISFIKSSLFPNQYCFNERCSRNKVAHMFLITKQENFFQKNLH